ncbi:hypothetical protein [Maritimibacter dapengensis]|uniref:Uncharacterized protein n=1 Tax=Maritimibacter dapengensis TaxID=2836868 RepID=A0ABS6T7Q9_9RHOB|nr:hypothetical protein [Maritimibacter dapengensis]MBV7380531.1 hypothetical protein [Maritimibacter dapengensis]
MNHGKTNIAAGLLFLAAFMAYGFLLIYLRDFAPGKEQWIADYGLGTHFEARLAHVHGNLFALMNVMIGFLLLKLPIGATSAKWVSWLALAGMLMPIGIVAEIVLSASPALVLAGAISMVVSVAWLGLASWRMRQATA